MKEIKTTVVAILALMFALNACAAETTPKPPDPQPPVDAQALQEWQDMRFGLFIHWGLYSKTAGYWKGRRARNSGHIMLYERIPVQEWGELAADFNPTKFDADAWVLAAKNAGMKYLVITTKHHDGLAMYNSPSSDYDLTDKSPFKRDPMKEIADACHRHGIKLGFYYSLGRDWQDPDVPTNWPRKAGRSNTWDYPDEDAKVFNRYFERKVKPQITELLTQYGDVSIMWFDTPELISYKESAELRRLIHSHQPKCIINSRIGHGLGDYKVREQTIGKMYANPWESCVTMARHWNYDKDEKGSYKSPELIVHQLLEIVSKGGNYLLNVGPTAEGEFTQDTLTRLQSVGKWMKIHGEGIYGTRPWTVDSEPLKDMMAERQYGDSTVEEDMKDAVNDATAKTIPSEVRFTVRGKTIYAFLCRWDGKDVLIKSLALDRAAIETVTLLGYANDLTWKQSADGLEIEMPSFNPVEEIPIQGLKITQR